MNKKELKQLVLKESSISSTIIKIPYACVSVVYKSYYGVGFAKWSTEDMNLVGRALKILKHLDKECCTICGDKFDHCINLLEKYGWSEERAKEIAHGRAVMDIVEQILFDENEKRQKQLHQEFNKSFEEKSKFGLSEQTDEFMKLRLPKVTTKYRENSILVEPILKGYKRQWVKCHECSKVFYYDFLPYSLSKPIMIMPCSHGRGVDDAIRISEDEAVKLLKKEQNETTNLVDNQRLWAKS